MDSERDYKLNGDILEVLLWELLDLRSDRLRSHRVRSDRLRSHRVRSHGQAEPLIWLQRQGCKPLSPGYSFADEILLSAHQKTQWPRLNQDANERLEQLQIAITNMGDSPGADRAAYILESAQLHAWIAYQCLLGMREKQIDGKLAFDPEAFNGLEQCVIFLLQAQRLISWSGSSYRRDLRFLECSLRLAMGEMGSHQWPLEREVALLNSLKKYEVALIVRLQSHESEAAYKLARQMLALRPYSLRLQLIYQLVECFYRLSRAHRKLNRRKLWQVNAYRYHLLDRFDRYLKQLCSGLRLAARHPNMSLQLLEALGNLVSSAWNDLSDLYRREVKALKKESPACGRLEVQGQLLLMGAHLGGAPIEFTLESITFLAASQGSHLSAPLRFLRVLLALIQHAQSQNGELSRPLIERLHQSLEQLAASANFAPFHARISNAQIDLHLLYHRDSRVHSPEVMRLMGGLMAIHPSCSDSFILDRALAVLDELYDLWSGASFPEYFIEPG